jgi:hypothetical protein
MAASNARESSEGEDTEEYYVEDTSSKSSSDLESEDSDYSLADSYDEEVA